MGDFYTDNIRYEHTAMTDKYGYIVTFAHIPLGRVYKIKPYPLRAAVWKIENEPGPYCYSTRADAARHLTINKTQLIIKTLIADRRPQAGRD